MDIDANGLVVLTRSESMELLAGSTFGRIALTAGALPVILPVNYRLDGDRVVIRTNAGTKLAAATRHTVVAFEVDEIEPISHSGWSVLVQGMARAVHDATEVARLRRLRLAPWTPAATEHFVTISTEIVSGRRIPSAHRQGVPAAAARMSG